MGGRARAGVGRRQKRAGNVVVPEGDGQCWSGVRLNCVAVCGGCRRNALLSATRQGGRARALGSVDDRRERGNVVVPEGDGQCRSGVRLNCVAVCGGCRRDALLSATRQGGRARALGSVDDEERAGKRCGARRGRAKPSGIGLNCVAFCVLWSSLTWPSPSSDNIRRQSARAGVGSDKETEDVVVPGTGGQGRPSGAGLNFCHSSGVDVLKGKAKDG